MTALVDNVTAPELLGLPGLLYRPSTSTAIVTGSGRISVAQLFARVNELSERIEKTFTLQQRNQPVCLLLHSENPIAFMTGFLACLKTRSVCVPLRNSSFYESACDLVHPDGQLYPQSEGPDAEIVVEAVTARPFEGTRLPGVVMTTSGSTGAPKGVSIPYNNMILNAVIAGSHMKVDRCQAWSIEIDLALMSGLCHMLMAWQFDLPFYHLKDFTTEQRRSFFSEIPSGFGGGPIQLVKLVEDMGAESIPVMLVSSGDFLMPEMIRFIYQKFPDLYLHKLYGLTEIGGRLCCMPDEQLRMDAESVGWPLPGYSLRIKTENGIVEYQSLSEGDIVTGEVEVSSPLLFDGYYRQGGHFEARKDKWFATNDLASVDSKGRLKLYGRNNDVFKVGGEKVDRHTIETALQGLFKNIPFVVLPLPNKFLGQCPGLFVEVPTDGELPAWADIIAWLKPRVGPRYIPVHMYRLENGLPLLPSGKIDKLKLIDQHQDFTPFQ